MSSCSAISRDPEVLSGAPVFADTRVPIQALFDYVEAGHALAEFLDDFPTVTQAQALAVLKHAKEAVLSDATSSG